MTRVLLAAQAMTGAARGLVTVARALAEAGDDVRVITGPASLDRSARLGMQVTSVPEPDLPQAADLGAAEDVARGLARVSRRSASTRCRTSGPPCSR